jgi:hypothetical protein
VKTSHSWNVADVVPSVASESASNGQELRGENSPRDTVPLRMKNIIQDAFRNLVRRVSVGRRHYDSVGSSLPSEDYLDLRLRCCNDDE